ncbi:Fungal specific transcription factor domain containing protein [Hyaloscypha variabilis]
MNGGLPDPGLRDAAPSEGPRLTQLPQRAPRKRRRPALSCVQCRRRKVKCDRQLPCTQCSQYNNTTCVYDDPEVAAHGKTSTTTTPTLYGTSSIHPPNEPPGLPHPEEPFSFNASIQTAPRNFEIRSPSASAPWGPASIAEYPQSQQHASESSVGPTTPQSEASIQELRERLRKLEEIVSSSTHYASRATDTHASLPRTNDPKLKGCIEKSRFFGMNHWMNGDEVDPLLTLKSDGKLDKGSELPKLLKRCKDMARAVKRERPIHSYVSPDFASHIPSREVADLLVQHYFEAFESTFRILHRGSFFKDYEQYWKDPSAGSTSFVIKLLLVMAIGTIFLETGSEEYTFRSLAPFWVYTAQTWISGPFEKARLNLAYIEVQCLLILARQSHALDGELLWINVGTLYRTAMSMGMHRDPSNYPKISVFHAELRRRLWATIIELATQASLDCGMPPMFSFHDFDCEAPSNYDDADIDEETKSYPPRKPDSVFTDTSVQIMLLRSLKTRLEISRQFHEFRSVPPYQKVLSLSSDLTSHIRTHHTLPTSCRLSGHHFTTTHKNLLGLFTRRFLLALHHPFAMQSKNDARFYFSRKLFVDTALAITSHTYPVSPSPSPSTSIPETLLLTGGFFQELLSRTCTALGFELTLLLKEDPPLPLLSSPYPDLSTARKPLHEALSRIVHLSRLRFELGTETNAKAYLFLVMVQAQTMALERGEDFRVAIAERAVSGAEEVLGILRGLVVRSPVEEGDGDGVEGRGDDGGNREGGGREEEGVVDWDLLMQDTMMDFEGSNGWIFDSWQEGSSVG